MQSAPIKANGIPAHINDTALVPLPSLAIEVSCHRNRHVHVVSDICQDAFDDKFSHAKGECAQGKCEKSFFHIAIYLYDIIIMRVQKYNKLSKLPKHFSKKKKKAQQ